MVYGIVGGLGTLAGADLYAKFARAATRHGLGGSLAVHLEQRPFDDIYPPRTGATGIDRRKYHVYDVIRELERHGARKVLVGCVLSHAFVDEIRPHVGARIVSIVDALATCLGRCFPTARRVGVIAPRRVRELELLERGMPGIDLVHAREPGTLDALDAAIYGPRGIKRGGVGDEVVAAVTRVCGELAAAGAEIIIAAITELPLIIDRIRAGSTLPIIDCNLAYAEYALTVDTARSNVFTLGVVGGVGPAATVDFMRKVIANSPASRDQDHLPMRIEHDPAIPDRTAYLLDDGEDPTLAMLSACQRLESAGVTAITIPCNTAHAFLDPIEQRLQTPIIHMPRETARWINSRHPDVDRVGLLATSGTVASGVYEHALAEYSIRCVLPDAAGQAMVMSAIYADDGIKAGCIDGPARAQLDRVLEDLVARGVDTVILGCTELPLVFPESTVRLASGDAVALIDPTDVLAQSVVAARTRHQVASS